MEGLQAPINEIEQPSIVAGSYVQKVLQPGERVRHRGGVIPLRLRAVKGTGLEKRTQPFFWCFPVIS
jgi:hypothetical protein